ncbi:hypothetical protein DFR57_11841 [Saliterribacillus persicus]|uniref:Uncharacterized protein n=1 Tax=Saliterribacillus persicus TaxID=930114 RepID=A0A368XBI0_9BACI|nr:hypothetical protein DFR57_11841 [Saliterribacillus persicus]
MMKNKTRIILLISFYFLLCLFDYIFTKSFNWIPNILEAIVVFALVVLFIEIDSRKK